MLKLSIIDCVSSKVSRVLISKGGIKMLKPLHDNVVLKKEEIENKTASGIILTSENKNKPSIGVVEAIGDGCKDAGAFEKVVLAAGKVAGDVDCQSDDGSTMLVIMEDRDITFFL